MTKPFKVGQILKSKLSDDLYRVKVVMPRYIVTVYLDTEGKEMTSFTYRTSINIAKKIFTEMK